MYICTAVNEYIILSLTHWSSLINMWKCLQLTVYALRLIPLTLYSYNIVADWKSFFFSDYYLLLLFHLFFTVYSNLCMFFLGKFKWVLFWIFLYLFCFSGFINLLFFSNCIYLLFLLKLLMRIVLNFIIKLPYLTAHWT